MRARKNFSYLALLSLQSAPIPRKGKRPSLNLGDDTNFFAQFECAPLSSIIRRGVRFIARKGCHDIFTCHMKLDGPLVRAVTVVSLVSLVSLVIVASVVSLVSSIAVVSLASFV